MKKMMLLLFVVGFGFIGLSAQTGTPQVAKKVAKTNNLVKKTKYVEGIKTLSQPTSTLQKAGKYSKVSSESSIKTPQKRKASSSSSLIRTTFNKAILGNPYFLTKKAK
ncbi:MAG: hypothetical protein ACPG7F_18860 [Aggregatilineales bacterium]